MASNENLMFSQPITEIIQKRKSVRTYKKQPLTQDLIEKLNEFMKNLKGPFNSSLRFSIINSKVTANTDNVKLGTYGIIRGAENFILTAVNKNEKNLEELGYELEAFILYATSLGLGTCWLGGTFKKGEFAKTMNLGTDEILPIVSPIGCISDSPHIVGSLLRVVAGSNNRKPWKELFFNGSFQIPLSENEASEFKTSLEMVRLAPSASNKQPWRIVKDGNNFHFYLCRTKGYGNMLDFDIQRVDMGIAMCHFELTTKELGLLGHWESVNPNITLPDDNYQYIISWNI